MISTMNRSTTKHGHRARWSKVLALGLTVAAATIYYLVIAVWPPGFDGCGPPSHSTDGTIYKIAPFALAGLAALSFVAAGLAQKWTRSTLAWGAVAIVCCSGLLEFLVAFWVIAVVNHCFA